MDHRCLVRFSRPCRFWYCTNFVTPRSSVPVSKLPELVYETKKDLVQSKLRSTIVGHVGDGNFHALIIFNNDEELKAVSAAVHRLVHRAVALDGTCTGEHGVGVGKKEYLVDELGADNLNVNPEWAHDIDSGPGQSSIP